MGASRFYLGTVGPTVHQHAASVPLRQGAAELLANLAWGAVPTTLFCSGSGDVAAQLLTSHGVTGPDGGLPPNLRLVANFFRASPDGAVQGLSSPLVHALNKNLTTAAALYPGTDFTSKRNCVVIGSSPEAVGCTHGLECEEVLSIGFMKLTADFMERFPAYLESFDVVVLGDGSLGYVNDILQQVAGR